MLPEKERDQNLWTMQRACNVAAEARHICRRAAQDSGGLGNAVDKTEDRQRVLEIYEHTDATAKRLKLKEPSKKIA